MESWLIQITNYLLAQSWQIAILAIAVAFASILLRNRSAHVRYLLWLIVLAKCLVPPLYSIPVAVLPEKEAPTYVPTSPITERIITEYNVPEVVTPELSRPTSAESKVTSSPVITGRPVVHNIRVWLAIGWLAGVVALSLYYLLNAFRTQIWLQKQRKALSSESAYNIASIFMANGVKHMPRIWLLDRISQPFVWGLVSGSIYLPTELVDRRQAKFQAGLLGHELSHVVRLDAMVNSLQVIAQTVFWFHPFVWWANRKIRDEREKCCDEMTISRFKTLPEDYGEAIVETIASKYEQSRPVPSLAVASQVKNLEERINTMLRPGKKFYKRPSLIAAIIVSLAAFFTVPTALVLTAQAATEKRENELGKLEYIDHLSSDEYLARSTSVAISPDGRNIYTTAYGSRCLVVFSRDNVTGYIERLKTIPLKGAFTTRVSPNGRYVVCADVHSTLAHLAYFDGTNSVRLFERDQSTGDLTLLDSVTNGENGIENLDYVVDAVFSPDSRFVYVAARRSAAVSVFRITAQKQLGFVQSDKGKDECFDGARGISISPDGEYLYVVSNQANTLTVLQRNAETGKVNLKQVVTNEQGDIHGLQSVWDVTCSPDGEFVYTNGGPEERRGRGPHSVCAFKRMTDGSLSLVQEIPGGESWRVDGRAGRLRISPDGKYLYALGMDSDSIVAFQRDPKTGKLTRLQTHSFRTIGKYCFPADLAISPDGEYVYVGGEGIGLNGIIILRRLTRTTTGPAYALYRAACTGDTKRLQSLAEGGADINVRGERGYTALHWAARQNQKEAVTLLLDTGADINARTAESGWTPLHIASMQSNKDVSEILIARGADLEAENHNNRQTPIVITQRTGDVDFAAFLLDEGAKPDARNEWGQTPLHQATVQGDIAFADLLIKKGADVNAGDNGGRVPLWFAIRGRDMQMIEWLISNGADVNAKNQNLPGQTLLDFAKKMNNTAVVELLKKHGAKE